MTKHTKGPWEFIDHDHKDYSELAPYETRFHILCKTDIPKVKTAIGACGYRPNAKLIAAAPDLLEAGEKALAAIEMIDTWSCDLTLSMINEIEKAEHGLHEAIKKATE